MPSTGKHMTMLKIVYFSICLVVQNYFSDTVLVINISQLCVGIGFISVIINVGVISGVLGFSGLDRN